MDMHGHGHSIQRLELGNLLSDANLNLTDAQLDADPAHEDASSIRMMSEQDAANSFSAVLRGSTSLGTLCASEGFPSIPSSGDPSPNGDPYFNGGHYTQFYGCRTGGMLCGVQIEANYSGVRDNATNRGALPRRPGRGARLVSGDSLGHRPHSGIVHGAAGPRLQAEGRGQG